MRKVVAIVGMPGSGKSTASDCARKMELDIIVMGDVVREETSKRGLEPTPENIGKTMLNLRKEEGPGIIARKCREKILKAKSETVIVEGIRSLDEVEEFKKSFSNFKLVAIHTSPKIRFQRLHSRGRSDDPESRKIFSERDNRELKVGIGSAIAMADRVIINEGSLNEFKLEVYKLLEEISITTSF